MKQKKKKLTGKQKAIVAGVSILGVGVLATTALLMSSDSEEPTVVTKAPELQATPQRIAEVENVDERDVLSDETIQQVLDSAKNRAYEGDWKGIVKVIGDYDKEYNIDETEEGKLLRNMMFDANTILRLQEMGDTPEAVERAVEDLPNVNLPEMFILGLYYLPRNVILELSSSTLALAPTQRGFVEIVDKQFIPNSTEDGYNEEIEEHEAIMQFYTGPLSETFVDGFIRYEIMNGDIEEYVYITYKDDSPSILIGFYSDDTNPANTTKTVAHYLEFREMVNEGIDKWYTDEPVDEVDTTEDESDETEEAEE